MKILFSSIFILHTLLSTGQQVCVKVHSNEESLPYAYVYINGRIIGSTDSLGLANIDSSQLMLGDTIGASYVGRNTTYINYDGKDRYDINMAENNDIAPVIIMPSAHIRDFFAKQIKIMRLPRFYQETKGDFKIHFSKLDRTIQGTVTIAPVYVHAGNYSVESEFSLLSDTTSLSRYVESTAYFMHMTELYSDLSKHRYLNEGLQVLDEGTEDGLDVYSIIRSYSTEYANAQVRIYVDPETKILKKAFIISPESHLTTLIMAEFQNRNKVIFPKHIEVKLFKNFTSNLPDIIYTIDHITLSPPNFKKYKKRQNELYLQFKKRETH